MIRGNRIYNGKWSSGAGAAASAADILLYSGAASERHIIDGNHCLSNNSQGIFSTALGFDGDVILSNNICVTLDPATCTETGTWSLIANGGNRRHGIVISYITAQAGRPRTIVNANLCRNTIWTGIYKQGESDGEVIISNNICDLNGYDVTNTLSGGVYIDSAANVNINGNSISNFQNTAISTGGITINDSTTQNIPGLVSNNKIINSLGAGIALGTFSKLITINNNVISSSGERDIYIVHSAGSALVGGHTITNNTIYRTTGNNITGIFIDLQNSTRVTTVKNNYIRGANNANNSVNNAGIFIRQSTNLIQTDGNIVENFYYGFHSSAYYGGGRLLDRVIQNNIIRDCAVGFDVSATDNNSTLPLVNNVFINTTTQVDNTLGFVVGRIVQRLGNSLIWQTTSVPTVGSWAVGDRSQNSAPAVGSPKAWACTVTGNPGTWVSEGNL